VRLWGSCPRRHPEGSNYFDSLEKQGDGGVVLQTRGRLQCALGQSAAISWCSRIVSTTVEWPPVISGSQERPHMVGALISLLIYLLIVGIILWLVLYVISVIPMPAPFPQIARVVVIVIACLIVILLLLQLIGGLAPGPVHMRSLF
jgi:hypothetical protein